MCIRINTQGEKGEKTKQYIGIYLDNKLVLTLLAREYGEYIGRFKKKRKHINDHDEPLTQANGSELRPKCLTKDKY